MHSYVQASKKLRRAAKKEAAKKEDAKQEATYEAVGCPHDEDLGRRLQSVGLLTYLLTYLPPMVGNVVPSPDGT